MAARRQRPAHGVHGRRAMIATRAAGRDRRWTRTNTPPRAAPVIWLTRTGTDHTRSAFPDRNIKVRQCTDPSASSSSSRTPLCHAPGAHRVDERPAANTSEIHRRAMALARLRRRAGGLMTPAGSTSADARSCIPPAGPMVWICTAADGAHCRPRAGERQRARKPYRYQPTTARRAERSKYEHLLEFAGVADNSGDGHRTHEPASAAARESSADGRLIWPRPPLVHMEADAYAPDPPRAMGCRHPRDDRPWRRRADRECLSRPLPE